ncbi:MAG TPA: hypothetical protein VFT72_16475 [Opitutaceae bacterium]|nr:hypothetical protein [Opitutaceae bacterium]
MTLPLRSRSAWRRLPAALAFASAFTFALAAATTASARDIPPLSPEKSAELEQRFAAVKSWHVSFQYSADNPHNWTENGTKHNRTRWHESSGADAVMPVSERAEGIIKVEGPISASDSIDIYKTETSFGGTYQETRYDRGAGTAEHHVELIMDFSNGTYSWSVTTGTFPASYGGTVKDAFTSRRWGPATEDIHVVIPNAAPAEKIFKLPEDGLTISGSWSHDEATALRPQFVDGFNLSEYAQASPTRGRITWTISPAEMEPLDVELIVEPQGYDTWIPQGGPNEKTSGNQLSIKATLVSLDGGPLKHHAKQITFSLAEVSREKGVSLNTPVAGATDAPDLGFEAAKNSSDAEILSEGQIIRFAKGTVDSAQVSLSSFDWGAYGSLVVVARLDNGRTVHGHLKNSPMPQVLIPKRSPASNIADAWKAANAFSGSDGEDEDEQPGNAHLGDGLTAYEEYRGFVIKGEHTREKKRLDPTKKNLVVINEIHDAAKPGLALFERASGIQVLDADKADFPESRLANANRGTASGGEQYALRLLQATLEGPTAGENRPAKIHNKTPKISQAVVIDLALAADYYERQAALVKEAHEKMPYSLEQDIANTIAHEIAHGVGAPHHGKTTEFFSKREVTVKMTDWKVYGSDGGRVMPTVEHPISLGGNIGRPGNEASGDVNCIMAYSNYYQWAAVGPDSGPFTYYSIAPAAPGTTFCTNAAATGYNLRHKFPNGSNAPAFFGPARGEGDGAPVGNCLGAMNVRDW